MNTRSLVFDRAGSHKFWRVDVVGVEHRLAWGRVGTAGQRLTKTFASPEAAAVAAERVVAEKLAKGYVDAIEPGADGHRMGTPAAPVVTRAPVGDLYPMLAESVDQAVFQRRLLEIVEDPAFALEAKLDGDRVMVHVTDGAVSVVGRSGQDSKHNDRFRAKPRMSLPSLGAELGRLPFDVVLDGELVGGVFWVFDLPRGPGVDLSCPYAERRDALDRLFAEWQPHGAVIQLLPSATTHAAKAELAMRVVANRGEGLMAKRLAAAYLSGGRSRDVLKLKLVKEADVIVSELGRDGKNNAVMEVWRDGEPTPEPDAAERALGINPADHERVEVGTVSLNGKEHGGAIGVGDVLTVRYLYLGPGDKLVQPRVVRRRTDKAPHECLFDQLVPTNKAVMTCQR